jgi:hypothetical protein
MNPSLLIALIMTAELLLQVGRECEISDGDRFVLNVRELNSGGKIYSLQRRWPDGRSIDLWTSEVQGLHERGAANWHLMGIAAAFADAGDVSLLIPEADGNALVFRFSADAEFASPIVLRQINGPGGSGIHPDKAGRISLNSLKDSERPIFRSHEEILFPRSRTIKFRRDGFITFDSARAGSETWLISPGQEPRKVSLPDGILETAIPIQVTGRVPENSARRDHPEASQAPVNLRHSQNWPIAIGFFTIIALIVFCRYWGKK